ncbi:MAG TPA: hypothetical protein VNZ26_17590 [Vicinamibacterales bacterium]|nr:hypothetical protein [Vicinamibacterales bacterium]
MRALTAAVVAELQPSDRELELTRTRQHASAIKSDALQSRPRPANASIEIWRFPDRCHASLIERL